MSNILSPHPGDAFVLSGGSGSGKGTIVAEAMPLLVAQHPEIQLNRSLTTRSRRPNEAVDAYDFVSEEEFEKAIAEGRLLEWTRFTGNYYGTPLPRPDKVSIIEVEVGGAMFIAKSPLVKNVNCAFVLPINPLEQVVQLLSRKDMMNRAKKVARFATFVSQELPAIKELGAHVIVNDEVPSATRQFVDWVNGNRTPDPRVDDIVAAHEKYGPALLELMEELYPTQA